MAVSSTYLAILGLLAFSLVRVLVTLYQRWRSPLQSIPGPWHAKWTSLVLFYYQTRGKRPIWVEAMHRKYGPAVCIGPQEVAFCSVSAARTIYSYNRPFLKSEIYALITRPGWTASVFDTRDPGQHARYRRLLSGSMSESSLRSIEHVIRDKANLAVKRMGEEMKKRGAADVLKWWLFFSTDVIGELTFGDSFRMLEIGQKNQYVKDLEHISFVSGLRVAFPPLMRFAPYIPLPFLRAADAADLRLKSYPVESIKRYRNLVAADPTNVKTTLFTKLFKAGEEGLSQEEMNANAEAYIVGGSDTTSHTLMYLVWVVCRHINVKKKLVDEVATLPNEYTDEDLKKLPYLDQVLHETLRLFSIVPGGLPRDIPDGGHEVDGYWMPGGTTVSIQAYSMHRNPAVFPQPERFYPSRWETPTKEMKDNWMPFGGGARICIGLHLAFLELRYATASFFRSFPNATVSNLEGFSDDDLEQIAYFLMYPKNKRCLIQAS